MQNKNQRFVLNFEIKKMSIYLHLVFSTKYRERNITEEFIRFSCDYFKEFLTTRSIEMLACNGYQNHIHVLVKFEKDINLPDIVQRLKGGVAWRFNVMGLTQDKFRWSDGYYAQRVQYSRVHQLIRYIENQKEHHSPRSLGPHRSSGL